MGRSVIALFMIGFLAIFSAFWTGVVGCWRRSPGNITATAILMLFACQYIFRNKISNFILHKKKYNRNIHIFKWCRSTECWWYGLVAWRRVLWKRENRRGGILSEMEHRKCSQFFFYSIFLSLYKIIDIKTMFAHFVKMLGFIVDYYVDHKQKIRNNIHRYINIGLFRLFRSPRIIFTSFS